MKLGYFLVLSEGSTDSSTQEEMFVYISTSMITAPLMSVALNAQMLIVYTAIIFTSEFHLEIFGKISVSVLRWSNMGC